jgi:uracil-DNA glycosylase
MSEIKLHPDWKKLLEAEFEKTYFLDLRNYLKQEKALGKELYPPGPQIFAALNETPPKSVKVVILGQDPYHGPHQANGLCFSVKSGMKLPPSLINIYKEIDREYGPCMDFQNGDLSGWARQGVLLLNAILTVEAHKAASHQGIGWETFTDTIIHGLAKMNQPIVFMLWGNFAKSKKQLIQGGDHLILEAAHPSPFSAYQGFMGCDHFRSANQFIRSNQMTEIRWSNQ